MIRISKRELKALTDFGVEDRVLWFRNLKERIESHAVTHFLALLTFFRISKRELKEVIKKEIDEKTGKFKNLKERIESMACCPVTPNCLAAALNLKERIESLTA